MRVIACVAVLGVLCGVVAAQDAPELIVEETGRLKIKDAEGMGPTIEINCHGPDWAYSSQAEGRAAIRTVSDTETLATGQIPVPETTGGTLNFEERILKREDGLGIVYTLGFSGPMAIHNLQVSILLPVDRFAGTVLTLHYGERGQRKLALPKTHNAANWVMGQFRAHGVDIAMGEEATLSIAEDRGKVPGFTVYDLRRWERDEFELRIPLIASEEGQLVGTDDRFSLSLSMPGEFELRMP